MHAKVYNFDCAKLAKGNDTVFRATNVTAELTFAS